MALTRLAYAGNVALILALYVVFSPLILAGVAGRLAWEFTVVGWESVEGIL